MPGERQVRAEARPAGAVRAHALQFVGPALLVVEDRPAVDLKGPEALLQRPADLLFHFCLALYRLPLGERLLLLELLLQLLDPLLEGLDLFHDGLGVGQGVVAYSDDEHQYE